MRLLLLSLFAISPLAAWAVVPGAVTAKPDASHSDPVILLTTEPVYPSTLAPEGTLAPVPGLVPCDSSSVGVDVTGRTYDLLVFDTLEKAVAAADDPKIWQPAFDDVFDLLVVEACEGCPNSPGCERKRRQSPTNMAIGVSGNANGTFNLFVEFTGLHFLWIECTPCE